MSSVEIREISQIGMVVKDLRSSIKQFQEILGIGPWKLYTYAPPKLRDTIVHGKPEPYSMKVALTTVGSMMVELIQPLEGKSVYREFLGEKGEGVHHLASYAVDDVDLAIANLERKGIKILQSGRFVSGNFDVLFVYMGTEKLTGITFELVKARGTRPPPEEIYP